MDHEKVVVVRDNVSPLAAKIVKTYFVDRCNDSERPNAMFDGATGRYDEAARTMTVEAGLTSATPPEVGRVAVERAFQFAEDMLAD